MGINAYTTINGALYQTPTIHFGHSGSCHVVGAYGCISNTIYNLSNSLIDHIEVEPTGIKLYTVDSAGELTKLTPSLTATTTSGRYGVYDSDGTYYGWVQVSGQQIQVRVTVRYGYISLTSTVYAVYEDGCRVSFASYANNIPGTFEFPVSYYVYFNADGYYEATCFDNQVKEGSVTDYSSGTTKLTTISNNDSTAVEKIGEYTSGTVYIYFTFSTCTITDSDNTETSYTVTVNDTLADL